MNADKHPTYNAERSTPHGGATPNSRRYDLEERLLNYAIRLIRMVDALPPSRSGDHMGGQLLRSGTSPTLNHGEVEAAESLKDFIHKLKICLKELKESRRNLLVIEGVPLAKNLEEVRALSDETEQLIRIFSASIRTAQKRLVSDPERSVAREESSLEFESADPCPWIFEIFREAIDEMEGPVQ